MQVNAINANHVLYSGFHSFIRKKIALQYHFLYNVSCQTYYLYPSAGHVITGNINVIPDARVRNIISKGPKYRFPSNIYFPRYCKESAASLNDFGSRWCKRKNV